MGGITPSKRECWECGNVADHEHSITPWVNCKKCGSQDTRLVKQPSRDWKPQPDERVLVEAIYCDPYGDGYCNLEFIDMHSWYRQERIGFTFPLSSIRPMRKDGE